MRDAKSALNDLAFEKMLNIFMFSNKIIYNRQGKDIEPEG